MEVELLVVLKSEVAYIGVCIESNWVFRSRMDDGYGKEFVLRQTHEA